MSIEPKRIETGARVWGNNKRQLEQRRRDLFNNVAGYLMSTLESNQTAMVTPIMVEETGHRAGVKETKIKLVVEVEPLAPGQVWEVYAVVRQDGIYHRLFLDKTAARVWVETAPRPGDWQITKCHFPLPKTMGALIRLINNGLAGQLEVPQ